MIYKFRIILDVEEDVFRDIEIEAERTFEDFHNSIMTSFGFSGDEMAAFYMSDADWSQGEEIALLHMNEDTPARIMKETPLTVLVNQEQDRLIYIYDFLALWTCYVTLVKIGKKEEEKTYPNLLYAYGSIPEVSPEKQFESDNLPLDDTDTNDIDVQHYDDFDFNENWN